MNSTWIIKRMAKEIISAREVAAAMESSVKVERLIRWHQPGEGFLKLNTDGSYKEASSQACAGGILRDEADRWIAGFKANLGCCDSLMAEA